MIGITANHPITKKTVAKVNFDVGPHDRSQNTVKGKAKKGMLVNKLFYYILMYFILYMIQGDNFSILEMTYARLHALMEALTD